MVLAKHLAVGLIITISTCSSVLAGTSNILDYRIESKEPRKLPASIERMVIYKVAKSIQKPCEYTTPQETEVLDYARGSFTKKGATETVYLVSTGYDCGSKHLQASKLAVFSGSRLIATSGRTELAEAIRVVDIDNDGILEVATENSYFGQGAWYKDASLKKVTPKGFVTLMALEGVSGNNGGRAENNQFTKNASVFKIVKNKLGKIVVERSNYESQCVSLSNETEKCNQYQKKSGLGV